MAAALAVPAQAEVQYDTARSAPADSPGGGASVAGSPLGGLLGGLVGGGASGGLLGGLLGGGKAKSGAQSGGGQATRELTEAEKDALAEGKQNGTMAWPETPNSAEDATSTGRAIPELSPILSGIPLGGGGLTESLPVLTGASRMAAPTGTAVRQSKSAPAAKDAAGAEHGPFHIVTGLVRNTLGAVSKLQSSGMLDGAGLPGMTGGGTGNGLPINGMHGLSDQTVSGLTGGLTGGVTGGSPLDALAGPVAGLTTAPLGALSAAPMSGLPVGGLMASPARNFDSLSGGATRSGLAQAALRALPYKNKSELAPVIGQVAPAETAAVAELLPATAQNTTVEELTPLAADAGAFVETNGTKVAGGYTDVMTALGWTTDALTSSVRDTWNRD
ncbi:hypothetical protein MF672_007295 [Actinomadura sp. ATCC 31491]|uniref:DUF937 domain-containing protein n=1 Tax=Actinomadura luzonensis TaxID=2805427 RepID=A0ABT0FMX9_9ACTN|nr:hypothetical protein [Actinomadura luzonensis]MCK2213599.1 hypothetical protein [Actinomadura luzonensis]